MYRLILSVKIDSGDWLLGGLCTLAVSCSQGERPGPAQRDWQPLGGLPHASALVRQTSDGQVRVFPGISMF